MIDRVFRLAGWFLLGFFISFYSMGLVYATTIKFDSNGNIAATYPGNVSVVNPVAGESVNGFLKRTGAAISAGADRVIVSAPTPATIGASSGAAVPVKIAATASRGVPWVKLGASVGAVASGAWPVALSIAVPALLEYADLQLSSGGTIERDDSVPAPTPLPLAVPATSGQCWNAQISGSTCQPDIISAGQQGCQLRGKVLVRNATGWNGWYLSDPANTSINGSFLYGCGATETSTSTTGWNGKRLANVSSCPTGYSLSGTTCNLIDTGVQCPANSSSSNGITCDCAAGYKDDFAGGCQSLASLPPLTPDLIASRVAEAAAAQPAAAVAAVGEMAANDLPVQGDPLVVTGPATSTASKTETSTTTNPDNSTALTTTTTTTNTTNIYQGDTITSTVTNVTTINNPDGSTTVTESSPPEEEDDLAAPSPGLLPPVPDLYEQKYPDGFSGVWTARKAELDASPLGGLLSRITAAPPVAGGMCPSWGFNSSVLGLPVVGSIAPPCWLWDVLKAVVILGALFSARRIVFGG